VLQKQLLAQCEHLALRSDMSVAPEREVEALEEADHLERLLEVRVKQYQLDGLHQNFVEFKHEAFIC